MTEPSIAHKMHANVAYLKQKGASPERIQQEISYWDSKLKEESAAERKLSGVEKVAAVGSELGSGATLGLLDEAAGLVGGKGERDTQRFLQKQLEEENPKSAFLANVAGSVTTPGSFFKAAPRGAGLVRKALTVLGEGAAQGAVAGAGNAEGGLEERIRGAGQGAKFGAVAAGALGGAAKAAGKTFRTAAEGLGFAAPRLEDLVSKIPDEDVLAARRNLSDLKGRRLADEATVADVLPQGEGALRAAATANREVRKDVDKELRQRSSRLANRADERFSEYTGTLPESSEKTVAGMNDAAAQKAKPLYQAAEQEADAIGTKQRLSAEKRAELVKSGVPEDKLPPMDAVDEALALPYVQQRIGQLKSAPRSKFVKLPEDDHRLLDQVYKDIGKQIRSLERKDWALRDDLIQQRAILAEAITSRAPTYEQALGTYAGDMAHRDAYLMGHQRTPSDVIPDELASLDAATVPNYKQGKAQALRRDVPNLDVGEFARFQDVLAPIATKEKAAVFKATFGESAYTDYVKDLLAMAGLQRMKAGAGESTTVDKMLEQLHSDPEAIVGMIAQVLRGNPIGAIANLSPTNRIGQVLDKLKNNRAAKGNAEFLLRRGEADVSRSLDDIIRMRESAQRSTGRGYKGQKGRRALGVVSRTLGGYAGRE